MKKIVLFALSALAAAGLAGCQTENIVEEGVKSGDALAAGEFHAVSFAAGQPQSRTSMAVTDGIVDFSWDDTDMESFTVLENGVEGESTADIDTDGKLYIYAKFGGTEAPSPVRYDAYLNAGVPTTQSCTAVTYDRSADVLVAKTADSKDEDDMLYFQFKRVVAISQMTIKGMDDGTVVQSVTITSDKPLTGTFSLDEADDFAPTWSSDGTSLTLTPSSAITVADGKAVVNFITRPVADAQLSVTVTTDKGTYAKTFASLITLSEGVVKTFGVTVEKEKKLTFTYSTNIGWTIDATDKTSYYLLSEGKTITSPVFSFTRINKIEITERTFGGTSYNTTDVKLGGSVIASVIAGSTSLVKYSTTESWAYTTATDDAQLVFEAADGCCSSSNGTGVSAITVYYFGSDPILPATYSVNIDGSIENGTVTADPELAYEGDEITLTATPAPGYVLESLTVTNASTSEAITVTDDSFLMPAADVNVTASFAVDETPTFTIVPNNAFWGTSYSGSVTGVTANEFSLSATSNGITLDLNNGTSTNAYINNSQTRAYYGYTLKFTAPSGYHITDISFTAGSDWKGTLSASTGKMTDNKNWTGSTGAVTISFTGTCQINGIDVTLAEIGPVVAAGSVSLDQTGLNLVSGQTATLVPTVLPADATNKNVTWTSSAPAVATVSNGVVTAVSAGTTTITVTTEDGGFTATCSVTVTLPTYASLAELVAAGTPTSAGSMVNVTITDAVITSISVSKAGVRNGIFFNVGGQEIEIYCNGVPDAWVVGGQVSAVLSNCTWKIYNSTWELCPSGWTGFSYTEPSGSATVPASYSWDLTTSSTDWSASNNTTYFSQPYGFKSAGGTLTNKSIPAFSAENISQIKVGFKCLQNGATTSKITIYLVDKDGSPVGSGVECTPVNKSAASNTAFCYATFTSNLTNVTGFMMKVTTFTKNILVNGAEYEVRHSTDAF